MTNIAIIRFVLFALGLLAFSTNIIRYAKLPLGIITPFSISFGVIAGSTFLGLAIFLP